MVSERESRSSFDRELFLTLIEKDRKLFQNILDLFESDWPVLIEKIRSGLKLNQYQDVEKWAHKLNGSLRNFYAYSTAQLAENLEISARNKQQSPRDGEQILENLAEQIRVLQQELRDCLNELP